VVSEVSVDVVETETEVIALLRGEIDVITVGVIRDAIEPFLAPSQTVVLDLEGVTFMDSSFLNVLVQARGALSAGAVRCYFASPQT